MVEPSEAYEICVKEMLKKGLIRITDGDQMEQFYEVGAKVSVKWSREGIRDTNWRAGWYVGEVQEADPECDEIVQFRMEPELTRPQSSSYNTRHGARLGGKG